MHKNRSSGNCPTRESALSEARLAPPSSVLASLMSSDASRRPVDLFAFFTAMAALAVVCITFSIVARVKSAAARRSCLGSLACGDVRAEGLLEFVVLTTNH